MFHLISNLESHTKIKIQDGFFFFISLAKIKKTGVRSRGENGEMGIFMNCWCLIPPRMWPHLVQTENEDHFRTAGMLSRRVC